MPAGARSLGASNSEPPGDVTRQRVRWHNAAALPLPGTRDDRVIRRAV